MMARALALVAVMLFEAWDSSRLGGCGSRVARTDVLRGPHEWTGGL